MLDPMSVNTAESSHPSMDDMLLPKTPKIDKFGFVQTENQPGVVVVL